MRSWGLLVAVGSADWWRKVARALAVAGAVGVLVEAVLTLGGCG